MPEVKIDEAASAVATSSRCNARQRRGQLSLRRDAAHDGWQTVHLTGSVQHQLLEEGA